MTTPSQPPTLSDDARAVLTLLRDHHNVLVSGAPATGKSRLLAEVSHAFEWTPKGPGYTPAAAIAIPAKASTASVEWVPSPHRDDRLVFPTVFDQSTKMRDFLRGLVPVVDPAAATTTFRVSSGTLYRASQHARKPDGAALVVIDEINRGPAVAVFGPSIVALESDKRLDEVGNATQLTQYFELLDDKGDPEPYALPTHLYVLAFMNQADTSVEPLDVAFQRRFAPYELLPSTAVLEQHFKVTAAGQPLPASPAGEADVYRALIRAWEKVNTRLTLGRGEHYQIGHGALMAGDPPAGLPDALRHAAGRWSTVRAHVDEVFFGDVRGVGTVLAADAPGSPYSVKDSTFAGQPVVQLEGPRHVAGEKLYDMLRAIATS